MRSGSNDPTLALCDFLIDPTPEVEVILMYFSIPRQFPDKITRYFEHEIHPFLPQLTHPSDPVNAIKERPVDDGKPRYPVKMAGGKHREQRSDIDRNQLGLGFGKVDQGVISIGLGVDDLIGIEEQKTGAGIHPDAIIMVEVMEQVINFFIKIEG